MATQSEPNPRDFLRSLVDEALLPRVRIIGMVKPKEDSADHLSFSRDCTFWIHIPIDIVENIEYLGPAPCKDHSHPLVSITFKEPETEEGKVFAQLISTSRPPKMLREETLCSICLAGCSKVPPDQVFDCIGQCAKDCPGYG
jgi:hypothetical protein